MFQTDTSGNSPIDIVTAANDSKIILFVDTRNNGSLYLQKIDSTGKRLWNTNDILFSLRLIDGLNAISDGNGGIIFVGFGQSDFSIHALQCSSSGNLGEIITDVPPSEDMNLPRDFSLCQNFPNPFNPATTFRYQIPRASQIQLRIFDVLGREVATLVNAVKGPGEYSATWDANSFSSGVYFYKLEAGSYVDVKKLLLIR